MFHVDTDEGTPMSRSSDNAASRGTISAAAGSRICAGNIGGSHDVMGFARPLTTYE